MTAARHTRLHGSRDGGGKLQTEFLVRSSVSDMVSQQQQDGEAKDGQEVHMTVWRTHLVAL